MTVDQKPAPTTTALYARCEQLLREIVAIKSVVGEDTTAHRWVAARLGDLGMSVEQYPVEGRRAPLVLGVSNAQAGGPGVLFDGHYDTVHAIPGDWEHPPWGAEVLDGVLYGRGAVDSKGSMVAMLVAIEQIRASGATLSGPLYYMSDSDGEGGFRGAALMADLGIHERVGTVFSAEATSNRSIEIAYPGISTWKITAIGRTAHPTEPERGVNAVARMARLVSAVEANAPQRLAEQFVTLTAVEFVQEIVEIARWRLFVTFYAKQLTDFVFVPFAHCLSQLTGFFRNSSR